MNISVIIPHWAVLIILILLSISAVLSSINTYQKIKLDRLSKDLENKKKYVYIKKDKEKK